MFSLRHTLMGGAAVCAVSIAATPALAEVQSFDIPAQPARTAIQEFGRQSGLQILASQTDVGDQKVQALKGEYEPREALRRLLIATNLRVASDDGRTVTLAPQSGSAAGDGADGTVQALIVTAQKREENIQDVPIAMSAFTQEDLTKSQVAGGPDLMTQVPNFTFTKTNFSGYSIQIRGIGTQAISATTDPAVAVAFNNTPFIRNRFFEQEFYDLERVEVLRGPQGTLYGRNATAGVVNIISAKPVFHYEAKLSGDIGNYNSTRLEGMVNIPLVGDRAALRVAGAWTKRDGYDTNQITGASIDGRNLWSTRVSLRVQPIDAIDVNLIWDHFQENDDRLRSGKQLCHKDLKTEIAGIPLPDDGGNAGSAASAYSQGCSPASLYSPDSFQTPNGYALPYYAPLEQAGMPFYNIDVYRSATQSRDLRTIESTLDPKYQAKTDVGELQIRVDLSPNLTLASESAYDSDRVFSFEDYNRFNTTPGVFMPGGRQGDRLDIIDANGVFCDPQLGCADRLVAADVATSKSTQFSQEFRISSTFDGPFNFSLGANFLRHDDIDKYYVFINTLTIWAVDERRPWTPGVSDSSECLTNMLTSNPGGAYEPIFGTCIYIDPNPIGSLNDNGRNYFLSKNPYRLISYAAFGEATYDINPEVRLTAGLRWTVDKKHALIVPSWLLAGDSYGLPVAQVIDQEWREPTGRLVVDWKPKLDFTDSTLIYASYSHGYKAGGTNPPLPVNAFSRNVANQEVQEAISTTTPPTFQPEFINAYEVGTKNTLLDGRLTLNATAFYYDYKGYQISQIVNRSASNMNFDAKVWGAELEAEWRPLENLTLGFKGGYEKTRMANGSKAIDVMDRTAGDPNWVVMRPFPTVPSNCIVPTWIVTWGNQINVPNGYGGWEGMCIAAYAEHLDPVTLYPYVPDPTVFTLDGPPFWDGYPGFDPSTAPNNGEGIYKNLSGHELPNAPHFTATITADYTLPLPDQWLMTLHSDFYWQSEAWTRVFNTPGYDKLKAYNNVNVAAIFSNEDRGWQVMAYVKNVFNKDNITGAFLNSDDTGLTTNVFLNEPRLYGLRVTKNWSGDWELGSRSEHAPGTPYPFTIEIGGGIDRLAMRNQPFAPPFVSGLDAVTNPTGIQNGRMDWGNSGDLKVTYAPTPGGWQLSAGARYGKTNRSRRFEGRDLAVDQCAFSPPLDVYCIQTPAYYIHIMDYGLSTVFNHEDFEVVDVSAGHDFGTGLLDRSRFAVSLRYAQFGSRAKASLISDGGWYVSPVQAWFNPAHHTKASGSFEADRKFDGLGPVFSWDASKTLLGNDRAGHVDLDWSLSAGALIGDQKTRVSYQYQSDYYEAPYYKFAFFTVFHPAPITDAPPPADLRRSKRVTAPVYGASLGLSYEVQRVKIGAGYRFDRAEKVIDGGVDARKAYDRTIQGPYFKISVGFGG